jgi:Tfp pilus assembly protein PilO
VLNLLPVESEEERLLVLLSDLAKQSGVTFGTFAPQSALNANQTAVVSAVSSYPATINISGTYGNVQTFLQKLENAGRFINIDSGVFASSGASGNVDARFSLTAYYQTAVSTGVKK